MTAEFPTRYDYLEQYADAVDRSKSWQFLVAKQDYEVFEFTVVSKGNIPLLTAEEFPGIEACIFIDSEARETYSKMHVVRYEGDIVGLEIFIDYITGDLDGRTEGDEDPIGGFRQRHPFWALEVYCNKS